jgi:hypothetical protein
MSSDVVNRPTFRRKLLNGSTELRVFFMGLIGGLLACWTFDVADGTLRVGPAYIFIHSDEMV